MTIGNNPKELEAMEAFHREDRQEGLRLQEKFASESREECKNKDHCPCKKACRCHENYKKYVAIHRTHQEYIPDCMRPMINQEIKSLPGLTEHTISYEIEPSKEILGKE